MEYKVTLLSSLYKGYAATFLSFKNVQNSEEIKKALLIGNIKAAVINANMLAGFTTLKVIADRALHLDKIGRKVTKNIYSEVIFSLSPSNNITDSFKLFGMTESTKEIVVVHIHLVDDIEEISNILKIIEGEPSDIQKIGDNCNREKLVKIYKITKEELKLYTLEQSIITRIPNKDI